MLAICQYDYEAYKSLPSILINVDDNIENKELYNITYIDNSSDLNFIKYNSYYKTIVGLKLISENIDESTNIFFCYKLGGDKYANKDKSIEELENKRIIAFNTENNKIIITTIEFVKKENKNYTEYTLYIYNFDGESIIFENKIDNITNLESVAISPNGKYLVFNFYNQEENNYYPYIRIINIDNNEIIFSEEYEQWNDRIRQIKFRDDDIILFCMMNRIFKFDLKNKNIMKIKDTKTYHNIFYYFTKNHIIIQHKDYITSNSKTLHIFDYNFKNMFSKTINDGDWETFNIVDSINTDILYILYTDPKIGLDIACMNLEKSENIIELHQFYREKAEDIKCEKVIYIN